MILKKSSFRFYIIYSLLILFIASININQNFKIPEVATNKKVYTGENYEQIKLMEADEATIGIIIMWAGSIDSIPTGWVLCNGSNSTPDLRDKFIMGFSNGENPGATGGSLTHNHTYHDIANHTHDVIDPGHRHNNFFTYAGTAMFTSGTGTSYDMLQYPLQTRTTESSTTGIKIKYEGVENLFTDNNNSLPPYYKLAFLMKQSIAESLPIGAIAIWSGSINSIPNGWVFCDGSNGTPDLRERFILGVSNGEDPGTKGGSLTHNHTYHDIANHTHDVIDPGHIHDYDYYDAYAINDDAGGTTYNSVFESSWSSRDSSIITTGISINYTGSEICMTDNASSLPPYHKLTFIMKDTISNVVPENITLLWSNAVELIPDGWKFCNGSDSTPDLQNKFILGVNITTDLGATGGSLTHNHLYHDIVNHTHDIYDLGHYHQFYTHQQQISFTGLQPGGAAFPFSGGPVGWGEFNKTGITLNYTGSENCMTGDGSSLPPYYKLALIVNHNKIPIEIEAIIGDGGDDDDDKEEYPYIWIIAAIIGAAIIVGMGMVAKKSYVSVKKKRLLYESISKKLDTIDDVEGYLKSNLWKAGWKYFKPTYDNYMNRRISHKKLIKKGKKSMGKCFTELFEVKSKKKISK